MLRRALVPCAALGLVAALATPASPGPDSVPGTAGATTVTGAAEPARPAFYEPPATLPATAGTVVRTEPATLFIDPLGLAGLSLTATRVMYASKDRRARSIAVTGTVFEPKTPWLGPGARPLISYAVGTQGLADRCAPSRQMSEALTEYEQYLLKGYLVRGYASPSPTTRASGRRARTPTSTASPRLVPCSTWPGRPSAGPEPA
jgi:hypothetical protein